LTDPSLFDGSRVGKWQKRLSAGPGGSAPATPAAPAAPSTPPAPSAPSASASPAQAKPFVHPAALAAMANAGIVKELEDRSTGGKPISAGELANLAQLARVKGPLAYGARPDATDGPKE
jgi:NADH-quinone oxidoreductase subunit E